MLLLLLPSRIIIQVILIGTKMAIVVLIKTNEEDKLFPTPVLTGSGSKGLSQFFSEYP